MCVCNWSLIEGYMYEPIFLKCPRHEVWRGICFYPVYTSVTLWCSHVRSSNFVVLFMSLQLLLQYLMLGCETCDTVQICIELVHKGIGIYNSGHYCRICPLNDTNILTISHRSTVLCLRNSSYNIWCRDLILATQFKYVFCICMKETEFWFRSPSQNYAT